VLRKDKLFLLYWTPKAKFPKRHKNLRNFLYDINIENKRILYKRYSISTLNHMNVFTWRKENFEKRKGEKGGVH
jgi:hypothetical protein